MARSRADAGQSATLSQTMVSPRATPPRREGGAFQQLSALLPNRAGHDATRDAGKIGLAAIDRQSTRPQNRLDCRCLARSDFARKDASRLQQPGYINDEETISAKTVGAAVDRQARVIEGDLTRQIGECGRAI